MKKTGLTSCLFNKITDNLNSYGCKRCLDENWVRGRGIVNFSIEERFLKHTWTFIQCTPLGWTQGAGLAAAMVMVAMVKQIFLRFYNPKYPLFLRPQEGVGVGKESKMLVIEAKYISIY